MVGPRRELLANWGERAGCTVCISVPTVDEGAWAALEPGTAHPLQRLRAVRQLARGGCQRRRADGTDRSRLHDATGAGSKRRSRRSRTTTRRSWAPTCCTSRVARSDHFLGFLAARVPGHAGGVSTAVPRRVRAARVRRHGPGIDRGRCRSDTRVGEDRYGDESDRDDAERDIVTDHSEAVQSGRKTKAALLPEASNAASSGRSGRRRERAEAAPAVRRLRLRPGRPGRRRETPCLPSSAG